MCVSADTTNDDDQYINENFYYNLALNLQHIYQAVINDMSNPTPEAPEDAWLTAGERVLRYGY